MTGELGRADRFEHALMRVAGLLPPAGDPPGPLDERLAAVVVSVMVRRAFAGSDVRAITAYLASVLREEDSLRAFRLPWVGFSMWCRARMACTIAVARRG